MEFVAMSPHENLLAYIKNLFLFLINYKHTYINIIALVAH